MGIDVVAHVLELVFGPVFLLSHVPELNVAVGELGRILDLIAAGNLNAAIDSVLEGQFSVGTRTLTSLVGTVLWVAVVAGAFGELGELGGLLELFG